MQSSCLLFQSHHPLPGKNENFKVSEIFASYYNFMMNVYLELYACNLRKEDFSAWHLQGSKKGKYQIR